MDHMAFLEEITAVDGIPGYEAPVAEAVARAFRAYADDVAIDPFYNVIARVGASGPRVLVTAHQDEIGLMVLRIEDDGCVRVTNVGGLPARVLPASEVTVHTASGPLYGVVGAKPPHLLSEDDRKQAIRMKDLYVDLGMDADAVRARVRVGDPITMRAPLVKLQDTRVAGKTMDDRCCVSAMLGTAEHLKKMRYDAQVAFVSASQEEVGCRGAAIAAYTFAPDAAVVLDVTHAETPGADKWESFPLDKLTIAVGPNIHPALSKRLMAVADEHHIAYSVEPAGHPTWTDADRIQITGTGVPTLLIGIPLKYMHSSVELIDLNVLKDAALIVALFIGALAEDGEVRA